MDNILEKDCEANVRALEQLKYDLNSTNSDSDVPNDDENSRDGLMAVDSSYIKEEYEARDDDYKDFADYKSRCDDINMETDIILPQADQGDMSKIYNKKKEKSKKELEEEEREKMQ